MIGFLMIVAGTLGLLAGMWRINMDNPLCQLAAFNMVAGITFILLGFGAL